MRSTSAPRVPRPGARRKKPWLLGLLCGWPGALLAQQWLRHKTAKRSFQLVFWITVVVNMAGFAWMTLQYAQAV